MSSVRAVDPLAAVRSPRLFPTATAGLTTRSGSAVGAGVELRDLRGDGLVGDGSGGGKAEGWLRVETMLARARMGDARCEGFAGGICAYVRSRSEVDQPVGAAVGPARCFAGEGTNCCKGQALNTEWPIEKYPRVLDGIVHGKEP